MTLFFSLLPLYLLGNLHCIGMCGPLVMMLGKHRYRYHYFSGRLLSFSLAGLCAGGIGSVLYSIIQEVHLPAVLSLFFGTLFIFIACMHFFSWKLPGHQLWAKRSQKLTHYLTILLLKDHPYTTFLFGFMTVMLPCGQSLMVFSACALAGDAVVGLLNGAAFALLTSPSLFAAMHAHHILKGCKKYYRPIIGTCSLIIGCISIGRAFAELGIIQHVLINEKYHIVLF